MCRHGYLHLPLYLLLRLFHLPRERCPQSFPVVRRDRSDLAHQCLCGFIGRRRRLHRRHLSLLQLATQRGDLRSALVNQRPAAVRRRLRLLQAALQCDNFRSVLAHTRAVILGRRLGLLQPPTKCSDLRGACFHQRTVMLGRRLGRRLGPLQAVSEGEISAA